MSGRLPRWLGAMAGGVLLFLHLPILILVAFSFNTSRFSASWTGFTLDWYRAMVKRPDILRGLWLSLEIGLISALISTVLGTALALAFARHRFRGRATLESMIYVPLVTPEIVVGISLLALFASLGISLGVTTILIAHVAFSISFVTVIVGARLAGMDRSLEEAALTLGADEFTTLIRVTIPQLMPGVVAGGLLAFTLSFDDYVITSFVTGSGTSTLPVVVYGMVRRTIEPTVNAVSAVVLGVTTLLIYAADWISRKES
ncbi:MAG: ABC transporter permease [Gemmatimonadales bacterium]|nr:MAG: ABC transporter permease [Gemmatimonadales bacterium]